jgi:ubiquinone/menaquinone biosynthesis C-methylase UbiE
VAQRRWADQRPDGWDGATANYEDTVELITARFVPKLLAGVSTTGGVRLLDIAAGTGAVSLAAARQGVEVLATDFSTAMADRLREKVAGEGLRNVQVDVMDGQALDLPDATTDAGFDVVTCNFGVIFFPDPQAGFREMHRVLRPGGTARITTWGPPEHTGLVELISSAMKEAIPDFQFATQEPPPLQFANPEAVSGALREAGFADVQVDTSSEAWILPNANSVGDLMRTNPGRAKLQSQITPEQDEALIQAAIRIIRERSGDDPPTLSMEAHVFVAHK